MKKILVLLLLFICSESFSQVSNSADISGNPLGWFWDSVRTSTPTTLTGQSYYVSSSGNDANTGRTPSDPLLTITKVNTLTLVAGDTISFKGGESFTGQLFFNATNGTASLPIVLNSYGGSKARIIGSDPKSYAIQIRNKSYYKVCNLTITSTYNPYAQVSTDTAVASGGLYFLNIQAGQKTNITVDSCNISRFMSYGIFFQSYYASDSTIRGGYRDIVISNCNIDSIGHLGVGATFAIVTGTSTWYDFGDYPNENFRITNVKVSKVTGLTYLTNGLGTHQTYTGNGIALYHTDTSTIERCVVSNCGSLATGLGSGASAFEFSSVNRITVQYNEGYLQKSGGYDASGVHFDDGCTNNLVKYNYLHDNNGSGLSCFDYTTTYLRGDSNNVFGYNLLENNCRGSATFESEISVKSQATADTIKKAIFYNNTVYATSPNSGSGLYSNAFYVAGSSKDVTIRNNIFVSGDTSTYLGYITNSDVVNLLVQGNLYWRVSDGGFKVSDGSTRFTSFNYWQSAKSRELVSSVNVGRHSNPQLNRAGSQGINGNAYKLDTMTAYLNSGASTSKDLGLNLDSLFSENVGLIDFYGNTLRKNDRFDIGFYENPDTYVWQDTTKLFIGKSITPTTLARQYIYDSLIVKLQTDSIMRDARSLIIFATLDTNLALRSLKLDTIQAIRNGTMTFSADSGYKGDGTSGFIKTQMDLSTQSYGIYSQNYISTGLYIITDVTEAKTDLACYSGGHCIYWRAKASAFATNAGLTSTSQVSFSITTSKGFMTMNRVGSDSIRYYINGANTDGGGLKALASTSLVSSTISIGAVSYGGAYSEFATKRYSAYWIGAGLSPYRQGRLAVHLNWYMTRIGINQY
jgi:hypothetical protein